MVDPAPHLPPHGPDEPAVDAPPGANVGAPARAPVHAAREALRLPPFRLLLGSQFAVGMTQPMLFFTQGWYVNTAAPAGQEVLYLGGVGAARGVAFLLYVLLGGAIADRFPRRTVVILSHLATAGMILLIGSLLFVPAIREGEGATLPIMIALFATFGLTMGQDMPTRTSMVRDAVPERLLTTAIPLFQMSLSFAFLFAAPFAGWAIEHLGIPQTYLLAVAGPLAVLLLVRQLPRNIAAADPEASQSSILRNLADGLAVLRERPEVRWTVFLTWASQMFGLSVMGILIAAWVRDILGLDAAGWGLMALFWGVGNIVATAALTARGPLRHKGALFLSSAALFGVAVLGFSLSRTVVPAFFFNGLAGVGFMLVTTLGLAIVQTTVPNRLLGRVTGLLYLGLGLMQVSGLLLGVAAVFVGIERMYVAAGVSMLAITALVALRQRPLRDVD